MQTQPYCWMENNSGGKCISIPAYVIAQLGNCTDSVPVDDMIKDVFTSDLLNHDYMADT